MCEAVLGKWRNKIQLPLKADRTLRYVKYLFGAFFLWIFIYGTASYLDDHGDMYMSTAVSKIYLMVKMFLGISVLSFFFDRFFCRFLCYQKAWYNLIELISPTRIVQQNKSCSSCGICDKKCPMNVPFSTKQSITSDSDCISCYKCVDSCPPKNGALQLKFFGMKVNPFSFIILSALAYYILSRIWLHFSVELIIQEWFK